MGYVTPHSRRFREILVVSTLVILLFVWLDYEFNYADAELKTKTPFSYLKSGGREAKMGEIINDGNRERSGFGKNGGPKVYRNKESTKTGDQEEDLEMENLGKENLSPETKMQGGQGRHARGHTGEIEAEPHSKSQGQVRGHNVDEFEPEPQPEIGPSHSQSTKCDCPVQDASGPGSGYAKTKYNEHLAKHFL
jgi:hypothetical protein